MPKLTDLDARFVGNAKPDGSFHEFHQGHPFNEAAQGVLFSCPLHHDHTKGMMHYVLVWFADRGVPAEMTPKTRWQAMGRDITDLTLTPSINLDVGPDASCKWHGFIRNGSAD